MARIIKKYPNRRLYDTETSAYITLAEVKQFVLDQTLFEVHDARTNEDLTRSILLQIILEEEGAGAPMFSADMLSNIIRYYGHTMQGLMGNYLERSIGAFHEAQNHFQEKSKTLYGGIAEVIPKGAASFAPDAWSKLAQSVGAGVPAAVPTMMNDYLEKSASSVVGMQEELRKQAMQMFSGFPFSSIPGMGGATGASAASEAQTNGAEVDAAPAAAKPKRKTAARKSGIKPQQKTAAKSRNKKPAAK